MTEGRKEGKKEKREHKEGGSSSKLGVFERGKRRGP
jgi:hypothetical protein